MKISKTHEEFAHRLNTRRDSARYRPSYYLGPNWEAVINFWLYLDTLTEGRLIDIHDRRFDLHEEELMPAWCKVRDVALSITIYVHIAGDSSSHTVGGNYDVRGVRIAAYLATYELIGLERLLDQGYKPVFFLLFLNP
jgi:hypothetical protein